MYEIYQIKNGETIEQVASKINVDPALLYQINNLNIGSVLRDGENIIIPITKNQDFLYYTIQKGDNLYSIAMQYGTDPSTLAKLNGLNITDYIYPNQTIMVPDENVKLYFVNEGDTLSNVANNFNTNELEIIRQNDKIFLQPEQIIIFRENSI